MPSVIFLNGASSAGKTTLGKALQEVLDEPYLLFGLDTCFRAVPDRWGSKGEFRQAGFEYIELPAEEGHARVGIGYGPVGWRMLAGFQRGIAEIVRAGTPVIIDEVLLDERVRDHWLEVLAPFKTLYVGVLCDVDELERREKQRRNPPGLSRWSAQQAHMGMHYDVVVNTTHQTAEACARHIANFILTR